MNKIGDEILKAVRPAGIEAMHANGNVRFHGAEWKRVLVTLKGRMASETAIENVAGELSNIIGMVRQRWGSHLTHGTIEFEGPGVQVMVMPDGFRHLKDPPMKAGIVEILYREVSHVRSI